MLAWFTRSRFRVALTVSLFSALFAYSMVRVFNRPQVVVRSSGGDNDLNNLIIPPVIIEAAPREKTILPTITAIVSLLGTASTVFLAWRGDRRAAKESELKVVQMQQQINELSLKLKESGLAADPAPST